jgi:autotransporter-associated beta strand protein
MKFSKKSVVLGLLFGAAGTLPAQLLYWDTNGAVVGAGDPATGTWDAATTANWTTDAAGTSATTTYVADRDVVFAAGAEDVPGTVTVVGTHAVNSLTFQSGTYTFAAGGNFTSTAGNLDLNVSSGASATMNGDYNANYNFNIDGEFYGNTFRGGGAAIKSGSGTATFNRLDMSLTLNAGTVIYIGGGLNAKLKNTTINNTGTLRIEGDAFDGNRSLTINAGGTFEIAEGVSDTVGALSGAGSIVAESNAGLTVNSGNFSGDIEGGLTLTKVSASVFTFSGQATHEGNTTVSDGTFTLADNALMTFYIGADGVNNQLHGGGILNLDGDFAFDLAGAAAVGSWMIVDIASLSETFGSTFTVQGFVETSAGVWEWEGYTFTESTGLLTAVPEPSAALLTGLGLAGVLWRRRRN